MSLEHLFQDRQKATSSQRVSWASKKPSPPLTPRGAPRARRGVGARHRATAMWLAGLGLAAALLAGAGPAHGASLRQARVSR